MGLKSFSSALICVATANREYYADQITSCHVNAIVCCFLETRSQMRTITNQIISVFETHLNLKSISLLFYSDEICEWVDEFWLLPGAGRFGLLPGLLFPGGPGRSTWCGAWVNRTSVPATRRMPCVSAKPSGTNSSICHQLKTRRHSRFVST